MTVKWSNAADVDFLASPGARSRVMSAVVASITPDEWLVLQRLSEQTRNVLLREAARILVKRRRLPR